jgi:hypothetical protein
MEMGKSRREEKRQRRDARREKKRRRRDRYIDEHIGVRVGDRVRVVYPRMGHYTGSYGAGTGTVLHMKKIRGLGSTGGYPPFATFTACIKWDNGTVDPAFVIKGYDDSTCNLRPVGVIEALAEIAKPAALPKAAPEPPKERRKQKPRKDKCIHCGARIYRPGSVKVANATSPSQAWRPVCCACKGRHYRILGETLEEGCCGGDWNV